MPEMTPNLDSQQSATAGRAANHLQHGRYSLRLGALPPGCSFIQRAIMALRRQLEAAVIADRGEIDLVTAALIQTCCRHERHCQLAARWLKTHPALPITERLALSRDVARASTDRDKAIMAIGLKPAAKQNPWEQLRSLPRPALTNAPEALQQPVPTDGQSIAPVPADASMGLCGVQQPACTSTTDANAHDRQDGGQA